MIFTFCLVLSLLCCFQLYQYDGFNKATQEYNPVWKYNLVRATLKCCEETRTRDDPTTDLWYTLKTITNTLLSYDSNHFGKCYLANEDACMAIASKDTVYKVINNSEDCSVQCFPLTSMTRAYLISLQFLNTILESFAKK